MDEKKILEDHLREAACVGDTDAVQELINLGVDVNAKHSINGWTPLHWACKRNYIDVAVLLLKSGADKNIESDKGETPASVSSNPYILQLLGAPPELAKSAEQHAPTFVPNYIKNAALNRKIELDFPQGICSPPQEELVLKIRIAHSFDPDFIEVDLPRNNLNYQNLVKVCCTELEINETQIYKIRKLPNTKIRRDKDVQRLENFQEIEVVKFAEPQMMNDTGHKPLQQANGCAQITPTNNYQSISKKDQTILY